jgi:hypothetical protein
VVVAGPGLPATREAATDEEGFFQVLSLSPGSYTVTLSRMGLRTTVVEDVVVALGRTTSLGGIAVETQPVELEALVIQAPTVFLDPVHTSVGANLSTVDYDVLPGSRDYKSLITLLPHINENDRGDTPNSGGATGPENMYFIDGMNVTSPLSGGAAGTELPYNFIRSVEVKTGGYEAQYGGALGAVVNAVTFSGTNDPELNVFGFITHSGLAAEPKVERLRTASFFTYDVGARLSGPVVRDRLWYSVAYNPRVEREEKEIPGHGLFTDRKVTHLFAGKFTWKAAPAADLELSVFGDPGSEDDVDPLASWPTIERAENPDVHLAERETGGVTGSLRVQVRSGSGWLIEGGLSAASLRDNQTPATEKGGTEGIFADYTTGFFSGGIPISRRLDMKRYHAMIKATHTRGNHTFIGGWEWEKTEIFDQYEEEWFEHYDEGYWAYSDRATGTTGTHTPIAYLQDTWRASRRLTLNAGIRWSSQTLIGDGGYVGQWFANQWQPRVGFVLRMGERLSHRILGSYGRFYQSQPGWNAALNYKDRFHIDTFCLSDPRSSESDCDLSPVSGVGRNFANQPGDLEVENLDEFTLGYERMLGIHTLLTIRGIRRSLRSAFGIGMAQEESVITWPYIIGTPGKGYFNFLPPPKRVYSALELSLNGGVGDLDYWVSYVLSRTKGNYTGYVNDSGDLFPGGNLFFFAPWQAENSKGLLPNDRTHVAKLSGSYRAGWGLTFGTFLTLESGTPENEFGPAEWGLWVPEFLSPRGSVGRTPTTWDLNLRVTYDTPCPGSGSCRFLLDALHVGNPREVVWVDEYRFIPVGASLIEMEENPSYLKPRAFQEPMALRFGFEIGF